MDLLLVVTGQESRFHPLPYKPSFYVFVTLDFVNGTCFLVDLLRDLERDLSSLALLVDLLRDLEEFASSLALLVEWEGLATRD